MMDVRLIYIGKDLSFSDALSDSAESLKISFHQLSLEVFIASPPCRGRIVFIDTDLASSALILDTDWSLSHTLLVEVTENAKITAKTADIMAKTTDRKWLKKKIAFYLEYVQKYARNCKKIENLQKNLDQTDLNLNIQERIIEKINQISQLSKQINCLDMEKIATVCTNKIPNLISARFASLYTYDTKKQVLHLLEHNHPYSIARVVALAEQPQSPMTLAVQQKKLLLIKDLPEWEKKEKNPITRMFSRNYNSNSCIIAPLVSGEKVLGVLNLADKIDNTAFNSNSDLPPVQLLCEMIGSAMSNIELYDEVQKRARSDGMTNLLNHRAFYDTLDHEVHRANRYNNSLSLLMMDLDNLKQINDSHGHRAGDAVLIRLAEIITHCIRDSDVAARYGGDEFAIILPNTSLADATHVAERMVETISREPVHVNGKKLNVSASAGLGQYRHGSSTETFMNESDKAMFEAKSSGKNRVSVSEQ